MDVFFIKFKESNNLTKEVTLIKISKHAQKQLSRRAISDEDIHRIMERGTVYSAGKQAEGYFLGRKQTRNDNTKYNLALVICEDTLITAMHMKSPPRFWKPINK